MVYSEKESYGLFIILLVFVKFCRKIFFFFFCSRKNLVIGSCNQKIRATYTTEMDKCLSFCCLCDCEVTSKKCWTLVTVKITSHYFIQGTVKM